MRALDGRSVLASPVATCTLAQWTDAEIGSLTPLLPNAQTPQILPDLLSPTKGRNFVADRRSLDLHPRPASTGSVPDRLCAVQMISTWRMADLEPCARVRPDGIVACRLQLGEWLEDKTDNKNVIVWRDVSTWAGATRGRGYSSA